MPVVFLTRHDFFHLEKEERVLQLMGGENEEEYFFKLSSKIQAIITNYLSELYSISSEFEQTGDERNPIILDFCINIGIYYMYRRLPNIMMPERIVADYERTIAHLEKIAQGKINAASLTRKQDDDTNGDGTLDENTVFKWGKRTTRSHNAY